MPKRKGCERNRHMWMVIILVKSLTSKADILRLKRETDDEIHSENPPPPFFFFFFFFF